MVLDSTQRFELGKRFMQLSLCPGAVTKPDLTAAVDAVDDWIEANQTSYNNALPVLFRTEATQLQKSLLLMYCIMKRQGISF